LPSEDPSQTKILGLIADDTVALKERLVKKDEEIVKKDEEIVKKDEEIVKKDEEIFRLKLKLSEVQISQNSSTAVAERSQGVAMGLQTISELAEKEDTSHGTEKPLKIVHDRRLTAVEKKSHGSNKRLSSLDRSIDDRIQYARISVLLSVMTPCSGKTTAFEGMKKYFAKSVSIAFLEDTMAEEFSKSAKLVILIKSSDSYTGLLVLMLYH
jgi:hypothetical protein